MANMVRVSQEAYTALRRESLKYQFQLNRQISMGTIIYAALIVARRYPAQLSDVIATGPNDKDE